MSHETGIKPRIIYLRDLNLSINPSNKILVASLLSKAQEMASSVYFDINHINLLLDAAEQILVLKIELLKQDTI